MWIHVHTTQHNPKYLSCSGGGMMRNLVGDIGLNYHLQIRQFQVPPPPQKEPCLRNELKLAINIDDLSERDIGTAIFTKHVCIKEIERNTK